MTQFEKRRRDRISRAGPQKGNRSERCGRTSSSTGLQRGLRRCELTGMADFGFTFQTRCGCSCGQLPKPNRETTRFSHSKRETRKPPITIFAPILPTPHVVCYSHCISSDSAQFFCVFSRRSAGPPSPGLGSSTSRKTKRQKSGAARRRGKAAR